jgi:hypothetical protein
METVPVSSRRGRIGREVLPLFVLFAVCLKSTHDEWRVRDLTYSDETLYLACAWHLSDPGATPPKDNPLYVPLYVGWYRVLMRLPVELEYLPFVSHGALVTLLTGLFYALVRRLGVGRWMAVTAAAGLILNTRLAEVEPFPVHMATVLLTVGVLIGTYRRSVLGACGPVGFGVLAASYVRNEFGTFLLVFLPCYLVAGALARRRQAVCRHEFLPWAVPLVLAVGACACTLGLPLPDGPRGLFAFGQHYARNVVETRGGDTADCVVHFERVLRADFGAVRTFGEAVRARPDAVAWHAGRNLDRLPTVVSDLLRPRQPLGASIRIVVRVLILAVLSVGLVRCVRHLRAGGARGPAGQPLRVVLLGLMCAALVGGPSVVLIYPREHYLILPLFFLLVLAVSGLPAPRWPVERLGAPDRWKVRAAGIVVGALLVGVTPNCGCEWTLLRPLGTQRRPAASVERRETMALLRGLPRRPSTVVLSYEYSGTVLTLWMAQPVVNVSHAEKAEGFGAFVAKHRIEVIILDRRLLDDTRFSADGEFLALWSGTEPGSFEIHSAPGGTRIAVRRALLAPH